MMTFSVCGRQFIQIAGGMVATLTLSHLMPRSQKLLAAFVTHFLCLP